MPPNILSACYRDMLRCHVCMYVFYSVTLSGTLKHEMILIVQHNQSLSNTRTVQSQCMSYILHKQPRSHSSILLIADVYDIRSPYST